MECAHEGCPRKVAHRGLCSAHYQRYRAHGLELPVPSNRGTPEQRVWRFIAKQPGRNACWLWTGRTTPKGYGLFENQQAHRFVYKMLVGPIPEGLQLDHLCLRKNCVRPSHLDPVTNAENMARAVASWTHCRNGHPLAEEGVIVIGGKRMCARCNRERFERFYAKRGGRAAYRSEKW